jgi:hypothetical protein
MSRQSFGRRINAWLAEPAGEIFSAGKWRFWFPAVIGFTLLNAGLTAIVFNDGGRLQNYMGAVLVGVGGLLAWLCVGALHYSDSGDRKLARGVSALDSITLLFVVGHFSFLLWVYGHLHTLQAAEADYKAQAAAHNAEARQVQADNAKIADSLRQIAEAEKQRAKIENDSIYQARKAAEAGVRIAPRRGAAASASLSTSPVELAPPPKALEDSAAEFLARWDWWIRILNFGELALAVITLIYIRNWSAKTNAPGAIYVEEFPILPGVTARASAPGPAFRKTHASYEQEKTQKTHASYDSEGLKRLREALKDISFRLVRRCFKVDVRGDAVWIRLVKANNSTQETIHSAKAKLDILNDAVRMDRSKFRERLEKFLRENGFEI